MAECAEAAARGRECGIARSRSRPRKQIACEARRGRSSGSHVDDSRRDAGCRHSGNGWMVSLKGKSQGAPSEAIAARDACGSGLKNAKRLEEAGRVWVEEICSETNSAMMNSTYWLTTWSGREAWAKTKAMD